MTARLLPVVILLAALCSCEDGMQGVRENELVAFVNTDSPADITETSVVLNGSYLRASAPVSKVGFEWGTTSSYGEVLQSSLEDPTFTSGKFSAKLEGLDDATKYHFRAYLVLQEGDNIQYCYGDDVLFSTLQTSPGPEVPATNVRVDAAEATSITSTTASIRCYYEDAPDVGVYDRGVVYGTSASALDKTQALASSTSTSAYFTVTLTSLEPDTQYYYKAYVTAWDESEGKYVDFFSQLMSFTTESGGQGGQPVESIGLQYLGGYEIPALKLADTQKCSGSGTESYGNTKWYNYKTTNSNQMVITHTYAYNGKQYRNYTCLVDKDKQAPLWSAFVMQDDAYPDNGVGRTGNWKLDPGIPESWQSCFSSSGFSRGHFVASNYRQATSDANKETFYYTNQALQYQTSFNDGIWNSLELAVKNNAPSGRDTLYVVVGILYEGSKTLQGVPVPSHFYKCLMKCSFNSSGTMTAAKGCAYIFTNESHSGESYSKGITSIDAIEQRSGWDFFANVPASLQDAAEKQTSAVW